MLIAISKMYFQSNNPFFVKVMSSFGNMRTVLCIQHICNTTIHKSLISGLFKLSKRSPRDNSTEYRERDIFPGNVMFSGGSLCSTNL